ncbi:MAG TPA: hypothetical protein VNB86_06200, partial [Gaiellaceae bacterium]|nr:hypothetical protein [Gaiellaceae bacterium]
MIRVGGGEGGGPRRGLPLETAEHGGYALLKHLRKIVEGPLVWAPVREVSSKAPRKVLRPPLDRVVTHRVDQRCGTLPAATANCSARAGQAPQRRFPGHLFVTRDEGRVASACAHQL